MRVAQNSLNSGDVGMYNGVHTIIYTDNGRQNELLGYRMGYISKTTFGLCNIRAYPDIGIDRHLKPRT